MGKALILLCLPLCLPIGACGGASYESDFCLLSSPLRPNGAAWDAADHLFKQQIVLHNETGTQLCGWQP